LLNNLKSGYDPNRMPSKGKKVNVSECIKLYNSGLSMNEVGRRLGHHHGVIKYHLIRNGIKIRDRASSNRKPVSSEILGKMYSAGMSAVEIAKFFDLTYQCVYDRLAEIGVKTRTRSEQIKIMIKRGTYKVPKGKNHSRWNGGITISKDGYRSIRIDGKYIREHRYVWEKHNGVLPKNWIVHHINGDKLDNRIENLAAMSRKQHSPKSIIEPFRRRVKELEKEIKKLKKRVR